MSNLYFGDSEELAASALPASRLEALLNDTALNEDQAIQLISQSNLLAHLPNNEARHKLTTRINSFISAQNALGYRLAHLWLQQSSTIWNDHLVNHASTWATHIVNLLTSPAKLVQRKEADVLLASALELAVSHVFSESTATRQEFYRQVVTPNLPKCVQALSQLLDFVIINEPSAEAVLQVTLINTARLMQAHPAQYRSVSSKITEIVSSYLYRSEETPLPLPLYTAAAHLLTTLHLTGALASKGSEASGGNERTTQAQLWQMTLASHLRYATEAWRHAVSSYQDAADPPSNVKSGNTSGTTALKAFPKDPINATKLAHARLGLFLGSRGRPGLIQLHLKAGTPRPVPVPVGTLLALATDMLRIDYASRQKATSEAKLCTLQAAHLPVLHTSALTLIAQVAVTAPKAFALQASSALADICRVVEANNTVSAGSASNGSARLRMAAFATLALVVGRNGVGVHLDPAGRTTIRLARISAGQVANAVLQPESSAQSSGETNGNQTSSSSRKAKKARLYESDAVFGSTSASPKDYVQTLRPEEIASTISALDILATAYPCLVTGLSAQHHDLTQLTLNITIALIEILSDSLPTSHSSLAFAATSSAPTSDTLLISALATIGALCADAPSSILALGVPRILPLLSRLAQASGNGGDSSIRSAAILALGQVDAATKGKFVPIARGVGFGPQARDDFEPIPENAKLASQSIPLDTDHAAVDKDITAVLGRRKAVQEPLEDEDEDDDEEEPQDMFAKGKLPLRSSSPPRVPPLPTSTESPTSFSPDPVKPTYRPSTPRIGSPAASPSSSSVHTAVGASRHRSRHSSPSLGRDAPTSLGSTSLSGQLSSGGTSAVTAQQVFGSAPASASTLTETVVAHVPLSHSHDEIKFDADDDDDDEDMPEIDLRPSDDESEPQSGDE